jgi:hypothetical protein
VPAIRDESWDGMNNAVNKAHYAQLRSWCESTFPVSDFLSTMHLQNRGIKRFAFRHAKYVTMFKLKWGNFK